MKSLILDANANNLLRYIGMKIHTTGNELHTSIRQRNNSEREIPGNHEHYVVSVDLKVKESIGIRKLFEKNLDSYRYKNKVPPTK